VRSASLGAFAALLYGHVQVTSVDESALDDPTRLAPYKVLYLADLTYLPEARIANLKTFVREGGGLVATYATSLYDAGADRGDRRRIQPGGAPAEPPRKQLQRFGLEELIRATPVEPAGELAETLANYRSMTGGPYDLYLAGRQDAERQALTPLWHFQPVKALAGGEVWMDIVTGDGLRPILPGVIVSRYGKGRVVYCASSLESLFLQQNSSAVGGMLRNLVAKAASEPPPYDLDAPSALIANLTAKGDVRVLHLTNWTGNKLERPGANEYYLAPVEGVRLRIRIPAGKKLRSVALLLDAPYRKQQKGPALDVVIPRVEAYQAVKLEFE
jgi:hypothetical protein